MPTSIVKSRDPFFMATKALVVLVTTPDRKHADKIAQVLIEEKLAACVNILAGARSIYRWKGSVKAASEVVLIAKSRSELFERLEKRAKELHPYECPCIVAWPITAGHQPYLDWITQETTS